MAKRAQSESTLAWLTPWLGALATSSPRSFPDVPLSEQFAHKYAAALKELVADNDVRRRLVRAERAFATNGAQPAAQQAIREFLVQACWICNCHSGIQSPRPASPPATAAPRSEVIRDLHATAAAIDKVVKRLNLLKPHIAPAASLNYLGQRHAAGNPSLFLLNRKGWHKQVVERQQKDTLDQYLTCLASDIREEAAYLQTRVAGQRQKGGRLSHLHLVIDMVTSAAKYLCSTARQKPDSELVAAVINTLVKPSPPLDANAVRKRYVASRQGKLAQKHPRV